MTASRSGTAYLEIVAHGHQVRVQRTAAGKTLNNFWTVWLRHLLLENTERQHMFAVELRGSSLFVSADISPEGLVETVRAFASRIVPVPNPPIERRLEVTSRYLAWDMMCDKREAQEVVDCLRTLRLPHRAKVSVTGDYIRLSREKTNSFRIGELALMVEHHVALHRADINPAA